MLSLEKIYLNSPTYFQNVLCSVYGLKESRVRYSKSFKQYQKFLEDSQWWPLEKTKGYQDAHVRQMVKLAYDQIPFWNERFKQIVLIPLDI
jgi:phenylacetate-CoA ligase